jgi:hypothetical protein
VNVPNWDGKLINYQEHADFFKECFENRAFELKRIFRASEHEFAIAKFHELCDNKGPNLFVGKSEQHEKTFGGFTSVNWNKDRHDNYETDPTAFLF